MGSDSDRSLDSMEGVALMRPVDLRELFENAAAGIGLHAADGSSLWFNRNLRATLGYGADDCAGLSLAQLVEDGDVPILREWISRCEKGQVEQFEVGVRMLARTGASIPARVDVTALRGENGRLRGFFYQVTYGRSAAETRAALSRELEFSRLTSELATDFIDTPDDQIDGAIVATLGRIGEFAGADRAGALLLDDGGASLRFSHEWYARKLEPLRNEIPVIPLELFPEWPRRSNRGVEATEDVSAAQRLPHEAVAWLQARGIRSWVSCPIAISGRPQGVVAFTRARPASFSDHERQLTKVAASLIGALSTRRRREQQQLETERRFREIGAAIDQAFWIFQLDPLRLVYCSSPHERIFGLPLDATYRDPTCIYDIVVPEDRAKLVALFERNSEVSDWPREADYRIRKPNGELRWLRTRVFGAASGQDQASVLTGITADVTTELRSRSRLQRLAALNRLLRELATGFIGLPSSRMEETIDGALARLGRFLDVEESYLVVFDESGETKEGFLWAACGQGDLRRRMDSFSLSRFPWLRQRAAAGMTTWVRESGEFPAEAAEEKAACERAGVEFAVSAPILIGGVLRGLLGFNDRRVREDWGEELIHTVRAAADMFGNTLARRETTRDLELLEQRHLRILDGAGEGIYGLDREGRTTFINRAGAAMIGWWPEELLGRKQHDVLHHHRADGSSYPAEDCPIYAAFRDGETHQVSDEVFWRRDGTSFPVEYVSSPIREGGELSGAVVVFRDVTLQRREAENREKFNRLLRVLNHIAAEFINVSTEGLDERFDRVLAELGEFAGGDRVGLFRDLDSKGRVSLLREWCGPDVAPLERGTELDFQDPPELLESLRAGESLVVNSLEEVRANAPQSTFASELGIHAFIQTPLITERGELIGRLGVVTHGRDKQWTDDVLYVFRTAAAIMAAALSRRDTLLALERRQSFERVVRELAAHLLTVAERGIDAAVEDGLALLGSSGEFEHCQVFWLDEDREFLTARYGWAREEAPMLALGEQVRLTDFPWLSSHLHSGIPAVIPDVGSLPREAAAARAALERWKVRALLYIPIREGARRLGVLAFSRIYEAGRWPEEFVDLVRVAADMVANTIVRDSRERELQERTAELAHAQRIATMSELTGDIVHEVGQPVAAIVNFAGGCRRLMDSGEFDFETADRVIRAIGAEATRAQDVLRSFQDYARKSGPEIRRIELNRLVSDSMLFVHREAEVGRVPLVLDLSPAVGIVQVDPIQVQQVVINLVRNALDACKSETENGLQVSVTTRRLGQKRVAVLVEDNGPGVSPDIEARLFDPFVSGKPGGLGLGLSLSRAIAEWHGGSLDFEAGRKRGARFRLTLPLATPIGGNHG